MRFLGLTAVLAVSSLLGAGTVSAQTLSSTRSYSGAGGGDDELLGAAAASGGGWYVAGYVSPSTSTALSGNDIWLAKVDAGLNVVSSYTYDGGDHDMAYAVAVGSDGMVYAVGASSTSALGARLWIGKFDASLNLVKQSTISYGGFGDGNTSLDALVVEPDGNIVAVGDVYVGAGSAGSRIWLGRFDNELNLVAYSTFTKGFGPEAADSLLRASNGDLYVGGGISPAALTSNDLWIGRFNSSLVLQASAAVAGAGGNTDGARGLALGSDGALYVTGIINTSGATVDAYLARFNATTLGLLGTASIAGAAASNDEGQHLINGSSNTLLLAGGFSQSGQSENLWLATVVEGSMAVASSFTQTSAGANTDLIHSVLYDSSTGSGFAVGRLNGTGRDAWWASFSASTAGAGPYPAPSSFAGTALSSSSIQWTWTDGVVNELGFRVMSGGIAVSGDLPAGTTSWTQTGLNANTAYGPYHARAFNAAGTRDSGTASAMTQKDYAPGELPAAVTSVSPASGAQGQSVGLTATGTRFGGSTGLYLERLSSAGSWAATGALPRAMDASPSVLLDDGRVLVAGGMNTASASVLLSSAVYYDPGTATWADLPNMNSRRHGHELIKLDDGRVLAALGQSAASTWTATAEVYDPATNAWTLTGSASQARQDAGAVKLQDGRVLVAGGYNGGTVYANTDIWDPATGTWTARAPLNTARTGAATVLLADGRVLSAGGILQGGAAAALAEVYDPTADTWTVVSTMSVVRYSHVAARLPDGRVIVLGGSDAVGPTQTTDIFDPATSTWTAGPSMSVKRYDPRVVWHGGRLIVAGGMSSTTGPTATTSVQAYDVATNTFSALGSLATARFALILERLRDGKLLAAGGEGSSSVALSSAELFTVTATTLAATGVSAPSSFTLTGTVNLAGATTGYWDVVARSPGEGRLNGGFRVLSPALSALSVSPASFSLTPGSTQALTVTGTFTDGSTGSVTGVLFAASTPSIASVNGSGQVFGVSAGVTQVTASSGALSAVSTVTVAALIPGDIPAEVSSVSPSSAGQGASPSLTVGGEGFTGSTVLNLQRSSGAGSWAATGAMPRTNVFGRALRLNDGRVMVAGGMNTANGSVMLSSASFYDPGTGTWSDGPSMSSKRHSFVLVKLDDGRVLAATGQTSMSSVTSTAEVWDPSTNLWTPTGSLSISRADAGFIKLADGRVLVAGGLNPAGSSFYANTDIWDPATGSWTARAPFNTARNHAQLVLLPDGRVLAIGGATLGSTLASVEVYSSTANAWTTVAPMGTPRYTHRAALLPGNRVLVVGGSDTSPHSSAEVYDVAADSWTPAPTMSSARLGPAVVSLGGRVLVAGGMSSTTGPTTTATAQWYDPALGTWSAAGSLGTARFHLDLTLLADGRILASAGETDNSTALSGCELLTVTVTTLSATGVSAPSSVTLTGTGNLSGAATGYWDVVARNPGEGRLFAGFRVLTPTLSSLSVSPSTVTLTPGATQPLTVVGTYTDGSTGTVAGVLFASSAPAVASVSGSGLVTGVSTGTTVITASSGAASASANVTVAYLTTGDLPVLVTAVSPSSGPTGGSRTLFATGTRFAGGSTGLYLERITGAGSWAAAPAMPRVTDFGLSVLLDDGRAMLVGGMNDATAAVILSSVSFFTPGSDTWSSGAPMSQRRHDFVLVKLSDGRVLAAGGHQSGSSYTATAEVYDPATGLWTLTGSLSQARSAFRGLRLQDGRVLVVGGFNGGTMYGNTDLWDPATGSWTARAPLNTPRAGCTVTLLADGRVLCAGGTVQGGAVTNAAEVYDPTANAWAAVSSMTVARYAHRAERLPDGRVMLAGGSDAVGPTQTTDIFDPGSGAWTAGPSFSVARYHPALLWHGGRLLAIGGMSSTAGPAATATAEAYEPGASAWTSLGSMGTARYHIDPVRLRDGRILAAGGEGSSSTPLSSSELFTVTATTIAATAVTAPSSFTLAGDVSLAGAATGYWDVVARTPGEGRLPAGFRVTTPALVSLSVTPSSATLEVGGQQAFTAVGTYDNASTASVTALVTWTSSPTAVATVSTAGVVTAQAAGTAVVTASTGSLVATASVTVSAFPAPTGFGGTALGPTSIRWDWTDNASGELGYRVMSGTTNISGDLPPNTSSWTQTGLSPNTQYGPYFARVFNSSATADSNSASKKTKANPPGGSSAPSFSATVATVTWSLNGNPAGTTAEVHRSTDGASFSLLVSSPITLLRDDSLLGCTSYYYQVRNADEDGFSVYDSTVLVRTLDTVPGSPGSLAAEAVAGGRVYLSWTGSVTEGVTGYKLYGDGGTGTFDYGTPLAVFTSTESSWTTGVLASSAAYAFNLRTAHRCGTQDATGVLATAASTATLASARAAIKNPEAGKRIAGNSVTVMAELTAGTPQTVSQVAFQYRASTTAPWVDIPAANVNHPNPDLAAPYFTHWNVTALAQGLYHLRAVAYDGSGNPDPAPGSITVIVDAAAPDITENLVAGEIIKQQAVNNAVVNTIASGGGDAGDALAKIVLPPGALSASTVTVTVEANPTITTATPSGMAAVGSSLRVDLSNGQHNLSGGQTACITLSYPANVTDPSALSIWSLDEGTGVWSRDFGTTVNSSSRTITGCTPHFSIFVVFQGVATATLLDGVRLYPNPYKPNSGNLDEGKPFSQGDDTTGIIIDQLPARVTIEIYSLSGRLVTRFDTNASGGKVRWNARNSDGRDVASGGYFAVVSSPGQQSIVKKFIIIR